jgi:hypothetical protein
VSLAITSAGNGSVSGLPVFCCTMPIVRLRQSISPVRIPTMSQARSPVVSASSVIAASRALTALDAHASTTNSSSASSRIGMIAWDRLAPAKFSASTKSE